MFPNSWYMLVPAASVRQGEATTCRALGTDFIVRREADGTASIHDTQGRLHAAHEVNGMVLVWHGDTAPDFRIAPCPELSDRNWTGLKWGRSPIYRTSVVGVQRDVVDNDHFGPVHHLDEAETLANPDGRLLITQSQGIMNLRRLGGPPLKCHIRLKGCLHGVGLLTYRTTITLGVQLKSLVLSAPTPVDEHHVQFHVGIAVLRIFPGASEIMRASVLASVLKDVSSDAVHWESPAGRFGADRPTEPEQARMFALFDTWLGQYLPSDEAPEALAVAS